MTHATFNFSAADTHTTKHPHAPALRRTGACRGTISVRLFPRLAIIGACLAAALLFGFAAPAQADEPEFVNNFDGGYLHHVPIGGTSADGWTKMRYHQAFTTGNNTDGYELKSVTVRFYSSETSPAPTNGIFPGTFKVFLCSNSDYDSGSQPTYQDDDSADSNDCDRSFDTLATYGVRKYTYTRDAAIALERSTTYIISLKYTPPNSGSDIKPKWILTGDEDETSDYGFEISNELWGRGWDGNSWESKNWNDQIFHLGLVGANGVPTAGNQQSVIIDEDTEHTFQEEDFGYEDADSDDLDHVKITDLPGQGTLWLDSDGDAQFDEGEAVAVDDEVTSAQLDNSLDDNLKYTPPADANGSPFTTFKFKVNDGYDDSAEYIFILNVTAVNDVPTVSDSTVDATEDALYTFEVDDFVFTDIDQTDNVNEQGDSLSHLRITTLPGTGKGTLEFEGTPITSEDVNENESKTVERSELVAGDLKYRPPLNANGTDFTSFDFKAKDGIVDSLSEATMTINVTAVNDLPTASNKTVDMVEDENTVYTFAEADFGFEDIDSNATLNEDPTLNATLAHVKLTSLPAAGKGMLSLAGNDITSASEDTPVEVTTTQLTAGDFTYTLPANGSGSPYAMFNFKVYDGAADSEISYTVSFYVAAVNDQPVAVNDPIVADANTVHVINVLENDSDVDGDTLSISALGTGDNAPADGTAEIISFGSTPAVRYTPNNDFIGTDTFTYTISDGQSPALTDTARVTMTVVPKLEGPINQDYPENGTEATNGMDNVVAVVATYSATGTPTWSLTGDDRDDFSINANGELSFNSLHNDDENPLPDYENATDADTDNEYKIKVQATVEVGGVPYTGTRDVTVTVTGVDEDVVWSVPQNTEFSFAENGMDAAATFRVTDPENDFSGSTYSGVDISSFNHGTYTESEGVRELPITFKNLPDYEDPTDEGEDNVYEANLFAVTGSFEDDNRKTFTLYFTIRVTDVNEAPVAGDDEPSTNEDTPVVISVLANDTDQDEDADGNPKDTLSVTAVGTADGVNTATETNPANGTVAITGNGTTVTYTPDDDSNGTDTFTYVVSDGELTAIGTVTVTVNAVNDPPVAVDDTLTIDEGASAAEIDVITNSDSDVDGDTLSVSAVGSAGNGTTAIKSGSTTTVTYTPNANFAGIDTFTYVVSDGQTPVDLTDTGTVTVKVTPTVSGSAELPSYAENGTGPVATYTAGGNPSPTWTLSGTDSDKFNIGSSSGVLSFKEPPDYEDPDGINYDVTVVASADGVTGMLDVTVTVTDVAAGNDPPVARDDTATTYEVTDVDIDVLLNDTAHEGITLSVTVGTGDDGPSNGTAVLKPGPTTMITYTPNTGFAGIDSFTYTVSDGQDPALTDTGTVTVRVTPTVSGSAVTGLPKSPSYAENGTGSVATYTANGSPTWSLSGTDSDKFSIGSATGKLTFNSPPNFENAADASDGNDYELMVVATITADGVSVTGSLDVTVTVTDVNEAPTFDESSTTRNIDENSAAGTDVEDDAVTATDPDTSELYSDLTYSLGGTDKDAFDIEESTGWISVKTGTTLNYETKNRYSVTVEVTDGKNTAGAADTATDDTITVDISVTDLPAVTGLTAIEYQENRTDSFATYETSGTVEWSLEDSGDDDHFSIDASTGELNFNATFPKGPDFENPTDANGDNVYELTVVANDSGETGRLGVTVEVTDASNAPVANADTLTVSEDESATHLDVIANDTIADGGFTLSVSVVGNPSNGTAAIKEDSTTEVTYTPNENFDGEDTFTYTVSNGARPPETETATGTVTVTVTAVNDPPVAADDFATTDGVAVVIDVLANDTDVDEDILSVIEVEGAANGDVVITDDGATVTYTPGENFIANGSDSFTYTVSDGNEASMDTSMVTVRFNIAPTTTSGKTVTRFEGMAYTFKVDDFDYKDADGHELEHVKIISLPKDTNGAVQGTLSLDGVAITSVTPPPQVTAADLKGGKLKHTPPANGNPVTTFSYKVNDGLDDSNESTIRINVVSVRSMSFGAAAYEADEGGAVAVKVILNQPAIVALTIPITVRARTAEAGDYKVGGLVNDPDQDVTGSLTFGAGQDTETFTITAEEDDDFDDETVRLSFGALTERGVTRGEPDTATLTIIDDEGNVIRARFRRLNNEILSKHALTLADVTIAAVTSRQEAGPTCADQANTGSLGGSSTLAKILTANVQTLTTGSLNLKQLLGTSSLRLRLTEDGSGAGPGCLTLWGQGDYRNLSSGDSQALDWNGDLVTGQVGADALLRPDLLAGLAVSWSEGDFGYTDRTTGDPFSGDYSSRMVSVHPYVTWWSPIGLDVWATGGYGRGEIKIKDEQAGTYSSDTTLRLASVGASGPLLGDGLIGRGTTTVRLKAQASLAQMEVEGHGSLLQEQTVDAHRLRLAMEGSHELPLASGGFLTPSFEVGLRHDGGDGATGTGLELGGGLRYMDPAWGLTIEGRGRLLSSYDDTYKEWGASGLLRLDPGSDRQGLALSLVPSYGQTASGVQRLWDQGLPQGAPTTQAPTGRLEAEVGYGLAAFAGQGLVTPYSAVTLGGGTQQYRVGSRLELGPGLRLSLEGTRQVTTVGQADQGIRLQADWQF